MKIQELKHGMHVQDRWFWDWGTGVVDVVLKTVVYIDFSRKGRMKFDAAHCQFLKQV